MVLQIVPKHLFLPIVFIYSLLLKPRLFSGELLLLLPYKILHHFLLLLVLRSSLIIIYTLKSTLIIHELAVILFIYRLFLSLKCIPHCDLFIKLLFLPFFFIFFLILQHLLICKLFLNRSLVLIHFPPLSLLLKLKHFLIILKHILLILNFSSSLFVLLTFLVLHGLFVLVGESGPKNLLILFININLIL